MNKVSSKLSKYYNLYFISLLRAFPCITPVICLLFSLIFQNKISLYYAIYFTIIDIFAGGLKVISNKIYD